MFHEEVPLIVNVSFTGWLVSGKQGKDREFGRTWKSQEKFKEFEKNLKIREFLNYWVKNRSLTTYLWTSFQCKNYECIFKKINKIIIRKTWKSQGKIREKIRKTILGKKWPPCLIYEIFVFFQTPCHSYEACPNRGSFWLLS